MIEFPFDERKALQAIGVVLKASGDSMNVNKLMSILYLAEREAIAQRGRPIIGGRYLAVSEATLGDEWRNP